jgi:uncharacterized protein (UPF0305 family)
MYKNELIKSLKIEASCFDENILKEKLQSIMLDLQENKSNSQMQRLVKYNVETILELKSINEYDETVLIEESKLIELECSINKYTDKYAQVQIEQKNFVRIVSAYLVFIASKPLHPAGMFDSEGKILYKNHNIVCPIKSDEIKKPDSLCRFCVCMA